MLTAEVSRNPVKVVDDRIGGEFPSQVMGKVFGQSSILATEVKSRPVGPSAVPMYGDNNIAVSEEACQGLRFCRIDSG